VRGMGWLRTERRYADFILEFECCPLVENYDSGLYFRAGLDGKPWPDGGWQVNLRHDMLGGLVKGYSAKVPARTPGVPVGQWVKLRLVVKGSTASLDVDGERAWEFDQLDAERGYLGIQAEDRAFDFRNIRLLELGRPPVGRRNGIPRQGRWRPLPALGSAAQVTSGSSFAVSRSKTGVPS